MLIEHRTYTLKPGKAGEYLRNYGEAGFAIHEGHLGNCVGQYYSEAGKLNQIIALWQFDDWNQRMERKARLDADPRWQKLLNEGLAPLVTSIETSIVTPTLMWRPKWMR
jgi:hypothetical protein